MEDKRLLKMAFYYMLKNVEQVRRQEESWFDHVWALERIELALPLLKQKIEVNNKKRQ